MKAQTSKLMDWDNQNDSIWTPFNVKWAWM